MSIRAIAPVSTEVLTPTLKPIIQAQVKAYIRSITLLLNIPNKITTILLEIGMRIIRLWTKSGQKFTIQYLSETVRLLIVFVSKGDLSLRSKTGVRLTKNGIPKIVHFPPIITALTQLRDNPD